jgi:chemosensory pili system protein ChpA (sensor histidine kinase/response regulator)
VAAIPEPGPVPGGVSSAVDPLREPLLLVADELAVTLNEARAALEQYAEADAGNQPLERCAGLLHTARGVLQITETWGASLLAEEMEQTCRHLLKSRRDQQADDGIEALSRAAVQLPAYVERIRDGGRDVPLVLLPLLNDLRAARGRPLLSESTLLLLNIAPGAVGGAAGGVRAVTPATTLARPESRPESREDSAALAKVLRPRFQLALLGWIRGDSGPDSLARLQDVVNRLETASGNEVVHQLWWVAGGVLEALADRGLEAGVSVKRLIGQADREMKRLQAQGERRFAAQPPVELVNNLLYYVARAGSSGPRITAIREAFNLSGLIPGDEQVEVARQSLAAPSVKLMQTVAAAIREDLARVKDVLDIYVRTGMERVEELAPQIELLKKIGDTLGVLGLGDLREIVQGRRTELEELIAGNRQPDEPTLVAMATALLAVEDRLEHQLIGLIAPESAAGIPATAEVREDADRRVVTQAVMRECLANLARVKEAISLVTERAGDGGALDSIPALLRGITAALLIVEKERAGRVAERIAAAASEVVQRPAGPEARAALERLADAIVSLEYYMETLQAGRREPGWMLDNAARSLDALVLPAAPARPGLEAAGPVSAEDLPATLVIDRVDDALPVDFPLPAAPEPVPAAWQGPSADRPVVADTGQNIDPDILELFIEEAREAVEAINVHFPAWEIDEGERESLLTLRRACHTLKGSGRMVGAELIGEYCWSIERLLNRVIDGTTPRTPELMNYLRSALPAIAELLEQLEVGATPGSDIRALMAEADALARTVSPADAEAAADSGDATDLLPVLELDGILAPSRPAANDAPIATAPAQLVTAVPDGPEPGSATPTMVLGPEDATLVVHLPPSGTGTPPTPLAATLGPDDATLLAPSLSTAPAMDPVLLDILSREVAVHLGTIRDFVARAGDAVYQPLPESIFRACHTLHGSLTMAGVTTAVEVAAPLNDLMGVLYTARLPADAPVIAATGDAVAVVAKIVDQLRAAEPATPAATAELEAAVQGLTGRLQELLAQAGERAAALSAESVDGGTASLPLPVLSDADFIAADEDLAEVSPWSATAPAAGFEVPPAEPGADLTEVFEIEALGLQLEPEPEPEPEPAAGPAAWDAEVAEIFAEEASELLESCDQAVALLADRQDEERALADLQRALHTLKGGARMAGLFAMGDLSHDLETLLLRVADGLLPRAADTYGLVQAALDELHVLRDQIPAGVAGTPSRALLDRLAAALRGDLAPAPERPDLLEPLVRAEPAVTDVPEPEAAFELPEGMVTVGLEPTDEAAIEPMSAAASPAVPPLAPSIPPALERLGELARELEAPPTPDASQVLPLVEAEPARASPARERPAEQRDFARVDAGLLEQLLNGAGEISIANARLTQQLSQIQFNLEELNHTVVRLRDQLRKLEIETEAQILYRHQSEPRRETEFDPLELDRYSSLQQLSRGLAETASDVSSIKDLLHNLSADTEGLLVQQARTTTELQDQLMRTRMVPFDQHGSRLARLVRQTAKDQGRQAELSIVGSGDLDRQVLEKMLPPFEHMLRNAVIHGLESPAEREALGKPAAGSIRIAIRREGAEVVIDIADDGRGLDVLAIRRKAVELGFVSRDATLTDDEAMQFILRSGFSTADQLTQAAGRGIGMDVVANQVAKLGGTLSIASERGRGTTFTLRLPFTLAVTQALIVRAASELYALPLPTVEGIIRIARSEFDERLARPEPSIEYGGQRYWFRHLGQFLGLGPSRLPEEQERVSIILVRAGDNSTALITDEMQDSREIVVKPVGAQLATIRGISGATILGDGRIVVILDVGALVRSSRPAPDAPAPVAEPAQRQTLALVVDDSITMRRVTQRLLERNGFRVVTAKDGVEAISVLQDHRPDIILLDVEMPRMDGYEFARHVRNDAGLARVPIIMVTSRVSEKHRARAIEIGVNDYLGKPYQERELLEAVQHQLAAK